MFRGKKRMIAVALTASLLIGGVTAFAKQVTETISVTYDNIKILIDGVEYVPKDGNGNVVEPFIYNGTTYLPVRAIANAFDKDVTWEAQTSTVILGSKNYDWLDQQGYVSYDTSGNRNTLNPIKTGTETTEGVKYDRGILFRLGYYDNQGAKENNDGTLVSYQSVEYLLNGNYKTFIGKIACIKGEAHNDKNVIMKIYGDGNLIYTSPPISDGTKSIDISLDVSGYKVLKINVDMPNIDKKSNGYDLFCTLVGIIDARLEKN